MTIGPLFSGGVDALYVGSMLLAGLMAAGFLAVPVRADQKLAPPLKILLSAVAIWVAGRGFSELSPDAATALFWNRISYCGSVWLALPFVWLAYRVTGRPAPRWKFLIWALLNLLLWVRIWRPGFVAALVPKLSFHYYEIPGGWSYNLFSLQFFLGGLWGLAILWVHLRRAQGIQRNLLRYLLWIMALGFFAGGTTFPLAYGIPLYPFGVPLVALYLGLLFLGLRYYERVEWALALRRVAIYSFYAGLVGFPVLAISFAAGWGAGATLVLLIGLLGAPFLYSQLGDLSARFVDKLPPFHARLAPFQFLAHRLLALEAAEDVRRWSHQLVALVKDVFGVRGVNVLIRAEDGFLVRAGRGLNTGEMRFLSLGGTSPVVHHMESHPGLVAAELGGDLFSSTERDQALQDMEFVHAVVSVPIYFRGQLEAILNLDAKENGEMFNDLDLAHLGNLARAAEHRLEVLLSGMKREQQTAVWAHDLVKPFGPKGSLKEVRALASGGYGEIPERARAMLGRVAEEMAFVGANLKKLIHPTAEEKYAVHQTSLTGVYGRVRDRFQGLAAEEGIDWRVSVPPGDIKVLCDEGMIEHRVIGNLVENAFRHTPRGGVVELGYRVEGSSFIGYVKDTGPGIPLEAQAKLFQPGVQLEGSPQGEAGLGLYSVKSVLEAQGGTVWVESAPGQGSCFGFSFNIGA